MDHTPYCIFPEFVHRDHIFRMRITDRQSNIPPIIRSRLPMVETSLLIASRSDNHAFALSTEDQTAEYLTNAY
jgi:hypothetical protein